MSDELEQVKAERDELARHLERVLFDLHPVSASTAGPRGGIGGQAITAFCALLHPYTDQQEQLAAEAENALRMHYLRREREGR